jgi:hypothetical protein
VQPSASSDRSGARSARHLSPARRYLALNTGLERTLLRVRGAFHGATLGLSSDAFLEAVDEAYYDGRAEYTDEAYNRQGLWGWEQRALDRHFTGCSYLLVTGAGGGREVLALAEQGFGPVGFEVHEGLRTYGNNLLEADGHQARILPSPRDRFPAFDGLADGAVVGWGSYMLLRGRERRTAFLQDLRGAVRPGAPVLLSFFFRRELGPYLGTVARVGRLLGGGGRIPVDEGDGMDPNYVHYFTETEIRQELLEAGWSLEEYGAEDYGWAVGRAR